jgi:hypothetical protein
MIILEISLGTDLIRIKLRTWTAAAQSRVMIAIINRKSSQPAVADNMLRRTPPETSDRWCRFALTGVGSSRPPLTILSPSAFSRSLWHVVQAAPSNTDFTPRWSLVRNHS